MRYRLPLALAGALACGPAPEIDLTTDSVKGARTCPDPNGPLQIPGLLQRNPVPLLAGAPSVCAAQGPNTPCAPHLVWYPGVVQPKDVLVVYLPGTGAVPGIQTYVQLAAVHAGYRTIGLSYDNQEDVDGACSPFPNCSTACGTRARQEIVLGTSVSSEVTVLRGDSVLERLYRLLENLDSIEPTVGWDAYYVPTAGNITPANIVWSKIIIAGFSQGAGHAAYISHTRQVHGLFVIDGAGETCLDNLGNEVAAEWSTTGPDASATRPKYGVAHQNHAVPTPLTWTALGLGTTGVTMDDPVTDVIDADPPPLITHTAQLDPDGPGGFCTDHRSMGRDSCMPTNLSGVPAASSAAFARLFAPYLRRFCYACDAATCP
jgi:hypothetical protein